MNLVDRIAILVGNLTIVAVITGALNPDLTMAQQERAPEPIETFKSAKFRQYPLKVIASKQTIGRLRSFVWGDYFYAEFATQTETITFFIYKLEDCLLDIYRGRMITVRYNISDIYLPQASGYHRVNIIQKIEGIDVDRWQKSRSRSQIQQCIMRDRFR
jgi:hypothetical protein